MMGPGAALKDEPAAGVAHVQVTDTAAGPLIDLLADPADQPVPGLDRTPFARCLCRFDGPS